MRGSSPAAVVLSTTKLSALVEATAASIRDAIGVGRANAIGTQHDEYVRQLAKDFNRSRSQCDKQISAFVADIAVRGTLEDALEIPRRLEELARMVHAETHPEPVALPFVEIHLAEERAEGETEEAETQMAHRPDCVASKEHYLRKATVHTERRAVMDRAVRREVILAHVRSAVS